MLDAKIERGYALLVVVEIALGAAHLLWPEYQWGQGRSSYFNLSGRLTAGVWFQSMQFALIGTASLIGFHRERRDRFFWSLFALLAGIFSFLELTKLPERLHLMGLPYPGGFDRLSLLGAGFFVLILIAGTLLLKLNSLPETKGYIKYAAGWFLLWSIVFVTPRPDNIFYVLIYWISYYAGTSMLLAAIAGYVLQPRLPKLQADSPDTMHIMTAPLLTGMAIVTLSVIYLQIVLFQILTIISDYMTANSVIAIALLGISAGGLVGYVLSKKPPAAVLLISGLAFPFSVLWALGTSVSGMENLFAGSVQLMIPFAAASVIVTTALIQTDCRKIYAVDLLGAAAGAVFANPALLYFREEGSMFFLAALGCVVPLIFASFYRSFKMRTGTAGFALSCAVLFCTLGLKNLSGDTYNITRTRMEKRYPGIKFIHSRSSFIGRYDVIRLGPKSVTLKAVENARIIDTIRPNGPEDYEIDPRLPYNLINNPKILIIGVSGDGITKTSRHISSDVHGVEINPVIVELMRNELVENNGNSYQDINISVLDGRTYLERSKDRFDYITLLNAHYAKGSSVSRTASPEYLQTLEASRLYLKHLTHRGVLVIEEPVNRPTREIHIWKVLTTLRTALLEAGANDPAKHFFIFQWKTRTNNYIQILMKRSPFTAGEVDRLKQWLLEVNDIEKLEKVSGRILGPIDTATTTVLYTPFENFETTYSRAVNGTLPDDFKRARSIRLITDDKPFPFDISPGRPELKRMYLSTLILAFMLLPFVAVFIIKKGIKTGPSIPYLTAVSFTGIAYFLVEVVLIQRYGIYLGSPTLTFSTVVATLLVFSGLGSAWSSGITGKGLIISTLLVVLFLILNIFIVPEIFDLFTAPTLFLRIILVVLATAPMAFFMGIPFPFIMEAAKAEIEESASCILFAVNGIFSALAIPLGLTLSVHFGFQAAFESAAVFYVLVLLLLAALPKGNIAGAGSLLISAAALLWFLLHPFLPTEPYPYSGNNPPPFKIYALSYGRSTFPRNKIYNISSNKLEPFEWYFWVVKGRGKTILVDTGFKSEEKLRRWGFTDYIPPEVRLKQLGVFPEDVTDVVLTHAHWDHIGRVGIYPKATVWIQKAEYNYMSAILSMENRSAKGMEYKDLKVLKHINAQGRLKIIDGEAQLTKGFDLFPGGAHTPGSQYAVVDSLDGPVVLGGDTAYIYNNIFKHKPTGSTVDAAANLAAIRHFHKLAASPFFIIPGHDPRVLRIFPSVSEGIVKVAAETR